MHFWRVIVGYPLIDKKLNEQMKNYITCYCNNKIGWKVLWTGFYWFRIGTTVMNLRIP
jgi:hypothetical protein